MLKMFDPKKSLLELRIVQLAFVIPLIFSVAIAIAIICNTNLYFKFSADGFNEMFNLFKIPFGFLGLIIPLVALCASNHRSEQTKAQINQSAEQNHFSNRFKHLEEFEKHCTKNYYEEKEKNENSIKTSPPALASFSRNMAPHIHPKFVRKIYAKIYGEKPDVDFVMRESLQNEINEYIQNILVQTESFKGKNQYEWQDSISNLYWLRKDFSEKYNVTLPPELQKIFITHNGFHTPFPVDELSSYLDNIFDVIEPLVVAMEFDTHYKQSSLILQALEFQKGVVPKCKIEPNAIVEINQFDFVNIFWHGDDEYFEKIRSEIRHNHE
ncbi:hypothetical protein ACO0LG_01615 [Undibacterium sp. Ji42W]|uniref:hypothetical protein n=1 Tax=Undibacterium sp. Ji42W TaxID=3413039 RepID=UPI003BF24430